MRPHGGAENAQQQLTQLPAMRLHLTRRVLRVDESVAINGMAKLTRQCGCE